MKPLSLLIAISLLGSSALLGDEEKPKIKKQTVRPAIFADQKNDKRQARAAMDARWSKFGGYLRFLVDRVQLEFQQNCDNTAKLPEHGTSIVLKFKLQKTGEVNDIRVTEGDAGSTAAAICTSAVSSCQSYGNWTDEMVKELGDSQEFTFTFFFGQP